MDNEVIYKFMMKTNVKLSITHIVLFISITLSFQNSIWTFYFVGLKPLVTTLSIEIYMI